MARKKIRHPVNFPVVLNWQDKSGMLRRTNCRCVDLSEGGLRVEALDRLEPATVALVVSETLGNLGHASVRYCVRGRMKIRIGLNFTVPIRLGDPARRRILEESAHGKEAAPPLV